jgi:phosphonate transport system substrate-binding protein
MLRYIFLLTAIVTIGVAKVQTINFAPLPMVKSQKLLEQYTPMLEYLENRLDIKFNIVYVSNYDDILKKLGDHQIDLAFLGPLPYVEATSRYPYIKPLVRFLDARGADHYTCTLFKLHNRVFDLRSIKHKNFALTQKYSTCGFLATQNILHEHNNSLDNNLYSFLGSHTNAILEVVLGNSDMGSAKSSIVEQYSHFGLEVIAKSQPFPSFLLVYQDQRISKATIDKIQKALLALHPLDNAYDANTTRNWGKNLKYGVVEAKDSDYDTIRTLLKTIKLPQ